LHAFGNTGSDRVGAGWLWLIVATHHELRTYVIRYITCYAASMIVMVALDLLWLGVIAKPLYQQGIGHLMAARPNVPAAVMFYAMFPLGLMVFVLVPHESAAGWSKTVFAAALFGLFTYATYDLTNLATLKDWPVSLSIIDVLWGVFVSTVSAAAGTTVLRHFGNG